MAEQKKTPVKPVVAAKPPKQLVPRTAPKAAAAKAPAESKPVPAPVAKPAAKAATKPAVTPAKSAAPAVAAKPAAATKQPTKLVSAKKPVRTAKPVKAEKPVKPEKVEKAPKAKKVKLVRDSYAMPEAEYARIGELKKRLATLGREVKKSELLRGGIAVLAALNDAELQAVMGRVERIKTGRPAK